MYCKKDGHTEQRCYTKRYDDRKREGFKPNDQRTSAKPDYQKLSKQALIALLEKDTGAVSDKRE